MKNFEIFIKNSEIEKRTKELAEEINKMFGQEGVEFENYKN